MPSESEWQRLEAMSILIANAQERYRMAEETNDVLGMRDLDDELARLERVRQQIVHSLSTRLVQSD